MASSSQAAQAWQPKFQLDSKPLLASACVRVWDKGEGGRFAQSLAYGLLLPEDMHAFEEGTEESMGRGDGGIYGKKATVAHYCGNPSFIDSLLILTCIYYFSFIFSFNVVLILVVSLGCSIGPHP